MLRTNFLGMELENPVIIAAGPWNRDGKALKESIEAGAGAVVTESIVSDTMLDVRPRIAYDGYGAQNIRLYSDIQIEGWEHEMNIAKSNGGIVIASVSAHTPSELAYLASKMEKFGADAIELSVSNPMGESLEVVASHAEVVFEMTKEVVSSVKLPVIVKLSQNTTNISKVAKAVKAAGGSGVSAINTVRGILGVDIENAAPMLSTYGGISGEYIRPLGLASVATIAQTVDIPICGIGGIGSGRNALEYMMLGASVVQIGTAAMINGRTEVRKIVSEIESWLSENRIESIEQVKGRALHNLKSFDEMKIEPAVSTVNGVPCTENCGKCVVSCMYHAIEKEENTIKVDKTKCTGCGLCTFVCPAKKLKLAW
ncbi:MAG: 4Fe-4S binding protein [Bacillota bacterium]|nr:4Fe-4S binding protein [Bacillota bacterium]